MLTEQHRERDLQKGRGGRPRRTDVERDEHGRIAAAHYREDPRTLPAWNRYRDVATEMSLDPRLATQRGKLFFTKQLTVIEFEAANRWADMLETYDILILGRRRSPAPPALERSGHGESGGHDAERVDQFKTSFAAAHQALVAAGKVAESAVTRLCRDEAAGAMLPDARRGLQAMAAHFGLVKKRRSSS